MSPSSPSYREKLLDPRWQKKRLQILERDEWRCIECGDNKSTLHVHHSYYRADAEGPWDYEDHTLITLCGDCHEIEQGNLRVYRSNTPSHLARLGFVRAEQVISLICAFGFPDRPFSEEEIHAITDTIRRVTNSMRGADQK